jgi:hypothetical protein
MPTDAEVVKDLERSVMTALANLEHAKTLERNNRPVMGYSSKMKEIFRAYEAATMQITDEISDIIHELDTVTPNKYGGRRRSNKTRRVNKAKRY